MKLNLIEIREIPFSGNINKIKTDSGNKIQDRLHACIVVYDSLNKQVCQLCESDNSVHSAQNYFTFIKYFY